jgi:hypothetical protein
MPSENARRGLEIVQSEKVLMPDIVVRYQIGNPNAENGIHELRFPFEHQRIATWIAKSLQQHEDIWGIEIYIPEVTWNIQRFVNQIGG